MATPYTDRCDAILEQLRLMITIANKTATHTAKFNEQRALTNAKVDRLEDLERSLSSTTTNRIGGETSGRDPERAPIVRTPQVERTYIRRSLQQPSGSTAAADRATSARFPSFDNPSLTPEEKHELVANFNMDDVIELMLWDEPRRLHCEDWHHFQRRLISSLVGCNAPDAILRVFLARNRG